MSDIDLNMASEYENLTLPENHTHHHHHNESHSGHPHASTGTLHGHAMPGVAFILFGVWATTHTWKRFFESFYRQQRPYSSR